MKILLAYYRYAPFSNGPSNYIDHLRCELMNEGHQVDLLSHNENWTHIQIGESRTVNKIDIKHDLVHRYRFSYSSQYHPWIFWREMERYSLEWAARQLNISAYDVIHCHDFMMARALSRSKPSHVPLIVSLHNCKYHEFRITGEIEHKTIQEQQYIQNEEYLGAMSGDTVIVPSEWLKRKLTAIEVVPDKIQVIPYGIKPESFLYDDGSPIKSIRNQKTLLCPARLVPVKGHRYLFEAIRRLGKERDDFICLLAGEGMLLQELQKLAVIMGIEAHVSFLGKRKDIPSLMRSSDIVILPSLHDTFPLVILEGQMSGKPIISTNVGGIPEIVKDRYDGILVPAGDSVALANAIRQLLDNPGLRQKLAVQARKTACNRWDLGKHMKRIRGVYSQIKKMKPEASLSNSIDPWRPDCGLLGRIDLCESAESGMDLQGQAPEELKSELAKQKHYMHILDMSGVILQSVEIDPQGDYAFRQVPKGDYVLRSTLPSFGNKHISV